MLSIFWTENPFSTAFYICKRRKDLLSCGCNAASLAWRHGMLCATARRERAAYPVAAVREVLMSGRWKLCDPKWVGCYIKFKKRPTGAVIYRLSLMLFCFHPRGDICLVISLKLNVESCLSGTLLFCSTRLLLESSLYNTYSSFARLILQELIRWCQGCKLQHSFHAALILSSAWGITRVSDCTALGSAFHYNSEDFLHSNFSAITVIISRYCVWVFYTFSSF